MGDPTVSKPTNGPIHELHNPAVYSALKVLGDLPELYDWIYAEFPHAYNRAGGISVGSESCGSSNLESE
jgi:hypothetical protein